MKQGFVMRVGKYKDTGKLALSFVHPVFNMPRSSILFRFTHYRGKYGKENFYKP